MVREIVQYGHPVLRQRCRPVTEVDDTLRTLVADMLETMAMPMASGSQRRRLAKTSASQ